MLSYMLGVFGCQSISLRQTKYKVVNACYTLKEKQTNKKCDVYLEIKLGK